MKAQHYILGLDLGIASVGWAAVWVDAEEHPVGLLDVGVRTFERAEVPKTGDSLAKARREARSMRRLIRRRAYRLLRLRRLLKHESVLQAEDFTADGYVKDLPINVWQLRVAGLERKLAPKEWAAVLLHLVKHRGYLSQRKSETQTDDKELGRLLTGVHQNHKALQQAEYRTAAELAVKKFEPETGHLRNKGGDYSHTFNRLDLKDELAMLFERQRALGNPFTSQEFEEKVTTILMQQRDALSGDAILKMLGHCTFEPAEFKAAKNTYSAERFVWLTKLNNLRIQEYGVERGLTDVERQKLLQEPYNKAKLTYKQVRVLLGLPEHSVFKGLRYGRGEDGLAIESKTTLMEMKAYHKIRQVLEKVGLASEWQLLKEKPVILDAIGTAFSIHKTDVDIQAALAEYQLPEKVLHTLLAGLNFDKFIQLSLKALSKILPYMEKGYRYDEACVAVYGDHYGQKLADIQQLLPPIPTDEVRNPVVLRTLSQARKVINELIRRYGSPTRVHIETGREVGKSFAERRDIEKRQQENRAERKRAVAHFKELFPNFVGEPKALDILKLRLYEQQQGKCLYSGKPIDLTRLPEKGYVEVDHALPFSKTWDDSFYNKVLVLGAENQNKGNQTPYEYLGGAENSQRWQEFVALVTTSRFPYAKKQRILMQKIDEEGFKARNLNDTRYVARFLCQFIEHNLNLIGKGKRRVFASNGQLTAFLRRSWGLSKVREANDRHHALDAVVVACTTVSMQQKITDFVRRKEMNIFTSEIINKETGEVMQLHFPEPWPFFRKEVLLRIFSDKPLEQLATELPDRPESVHKFITPLFVSRAPNRKTRGQGHLETIKSAKRLDEKISVLRVSLTNLKMKDIENIVGYPHREPLFYQALHQRLSQFKDDGKKAFAEPFYKPNKDGSKGALVKAVRVEQVQKSGVIVRNGNGIADNATMVRVDVFTKANKNYLVPIYAWQVEKGILPNKAVIAYADEADWQEMDDSFTFKFSLYPNDLVEVVSKKAKFFGYYNAFNRATAAIDIKEHDLESTKGKNGIHQGLGVKIVQSFEKYQVDVLGKTIRRCKPEKRQDFSKKKK